MSAVTWQQRRSPEVSAGTDPVWSWQITAVPGLTTARVELRRELQHAALPEGAGEQDIDRLLLTFEELASNGWRHGRGPVQVTVYGTAAGWLVDVSDHAVERAPSPAVDRDPARGGMGLHMIARLAADHGWQIREDRKHVWASITPSR